MALDLRTAKSVSEQQFMSHVNTGAMALIGDALHGLGLPALTNKIAFGTATSKIRGVDAFGHMHYKNNVTSNHTLIIREPHSLMILGDIPRFKLPILTFSPREVISQAPEADSLYTFLEGGTRQGKFKIEELIKAINLSNRVRVLRHQYNWQPATLNNIVLSMDDNRFHLGFSGVMPNGILVESNAAIQSQTMNLTDTTSQRPFWTAGDGVDKWEFYLT